MKKKWFSILLSALMVCAIFAGTAFAEALPQAPAAQEDRQGGQTASPSQSPQPSPSALPSTQKAKINAAALVEGDGFTWDAASKTLTITEDTGDYPLSYVGRPYQDYRYTAENLVVEDGVEIGSYAFHSFTGLKKVTMKAAGNIGEYAFNSCSNIEEMSIESCGDIGKSAFSGCSSLPSISIGQCGNIGDNAFDRCSALKSIEIEKCGDIGKSIVVRTDVETIAIGECGDIASSAFKDSGNVYNPPLKTLEIGKCGKIGSSACYGLPLETLKIGSCTSIAGQAFAQTHELEILELGNCESIASLAFMSSGAPIKSFTLDHCTIDETAFYMVKVEDLTVKNIEAIGENAFQSATINSLTLSNIALLGNSSFAGCKGLTKLTIENVPKIDESSFEVYDSNFNNVETIVLRDVEYIGNYAFYNFSKLKHVTIDGSCGYVGAHAFSGCESLNTDGAITIQEETKLGYSDSLVYQSAVYQRVINILKGMFTLDLPQQQIEAIEPEGWASVRKGENNAAEQVGDTQLTKEAKWQDEAQTVADVLIQAYYTANPQMDFIIVADCSNSMAGFGSSEAMNSNFYNMQSKIMDVTKTLLEDDTLDTRIAYSTFGKEESAVSRFFEKGEAQQAEAYIWNEIVNYESDTNYSKGLAGALELVKQNQGRNTTVIFISDGQPYSSTGELPDSYYGEEEAKRIRAEGVQIISVLQQVPEAELASSQANMERISDEVFASTDLTGFSQAINDAIEYAYTTYTLTDTVDPAFDLDADSIKASSGEVKLGTDAQGNTTISWTISGRPFEKHTLSFSENLKADERGMRPTGALDTNEGKAVLDGGGVVVNAVETPVLPRGESLAVLKKWEGDNDAVRPSEIEVTLMRDGQAFETVRLTEAGQWYYAWPSLDPAYEWRVEETNIPAGYASKIEVDGANWTITNTYTAPAGPTQPTQPPTPAPGSDAPKTGDPMAVWPWVLMMLGAAGGAAGTLAYRKMGKRS